MELLTQAQKHNLLREMPENEMHKQMKKMFDIASPDSQHYIGQGTGEFGKDLVTITDDPIRGIKVTAYVVKMGNINGAAANGLLGTINTQINQALNTPTFFKEIGREVVADDVIVVIFGTLSNNAKQTLDGYLKMYAGKIIHTRNIEDMTKMFERFYSDVFHMSASIQELEDKYNKLDKILHEKSTFLKHCFIEPNLKTYADTKKNIVLSQNSGNLSSDTIKDTILGKRDTIHSLLERISNHKHFVFVEGEAGSGKSIFTIKMVQYTIEDIIKKAKTKDEVTEIKAPILLKSTKLKNITYKELESKIEMYYSDLETQIKFSMLIVDGLDEVHNSDRNNIIELCEKFCNTNNISLVFTTRKNQDIVNYLSKYERYELLPFELSQAIDFIKKVAGKNQTLVQSLLKNINELQKQIPMSPLSLSLLIDVAQEHNEIPASISELYQRYIDIALGVNNGDIEISQLFEPKYKLAFLTNIAYELFYLEKNSPSISKDEFFEYVNKYVDRHSHIASTKDFFDDLKRVSIIHINDETVTFSHKSFLDYFIAKYFSDHAEELLRAKQFDTLYSLYYTVLWEDVTHFYFGLKSTISIDQINILLSSTPHINKESLMYNMELYSMGRLLQYAWNTDKVVKKYGINESIKNILTFREAINKLNKESYGIVLPKIFSDATIMQLTDFYYTSHFLKEELLEIMQESHALLEDSGGNADISDKLYFFGIYMLVNNSKLEIENIQSFVNLLRKAEDSIEPSIYYSISYLLKIFLTKNNTMLGEEDKAYINGAFKTFKRKYRHIFEETLLFKNTVEARKFKEIAHQGKKRN